MREKIFIMELRDAFKDFRCVTSELNMPIFDMKELMTEIIIVAQDIDSPHAIWNGIKDVALFGKKVPKHERMRIEDDDDCAIPRFYAASMRLTAAIKKKIREHHAYVGGKFPYEFGEFLTDDTFYLRRKPDVPAPSIRHPQYAPYHRHHESQDARVRGFTF